MLHLLVDGANHLLIEGPRLGYEEARLLMWRLQMPTIGEATPLSPQHRIVTKAFREDIAVAMVFQNDEAHSEAVARLLEELSGRCVPIEVPIERR